MFHLMLVGAGMPPPHGQSQPDPLAEVNAMLGRGAILLGVTPLADGALVALCDTWEESDQYHNGNGVLTGPTTGKAGPG